MDGLLAEQDLDGPKEGDVNAEVDQDYACHPEGPGSVQGFGEGLRLVPLRDGGIRYTGRKIGKAHCGSPGFETYSETCSGPAGNQIRNPWIQIIARDRALLVVSGT
jgi:hypothetical protein